MYSQRENSHVVSILVFQKKFILLAFQIIPFPDRNPVPEQVKLQK
jgi:hypothetical protein